MTYGLLAGLHDPEVMARIAERRRVVEKVAAQMGCSVQEAKQALDHFENDLCNCGQVLH